MEIAALLGIGSKAKKAKDDDDYADPKADVEEALAVWKEADESGNTKEAAEAFCHAVSLAMAAHDSMKSYKRRVEEGY